MAPRLAVSDAIDSVTSHPVVPGQARPTAIGTWSCKDVANGRIGQFRLVVALPAWCSGLLFIGVDQPCLERVVQVLPMWNPLKVHQSVVGFDAVLVIARNCVRRTWTRSDERLQYKDMHAFARCHTTNGQYDERIEPGWRACFQNFADMRSLARFGTTHTSPIRDFVHAVKPRQWAPFFA